MSGYSRQELEAADDLNDLIADALSEEEWERLRDDALSGKPCFGRASWRRPDGKENYYEWSAVCLRDGDRYLLYGFDRDVTDRHLAEQALLRSKQQYRSTIDAMGDAICVVDRQFVILLENEAFKQFRHQVGWQGDAVGRDLFEVLPFLPDQVREEYRRVFDEGKVLVTEPTHNINGRAGTFEVRKIPVFENGQVARVVTVGRDITAHKLAEEALEKSEREKAAVLDAMSEAVVYFDNDMGLLWANKATARLVGADPATLVGKRCYDLWHKDEPRCRGCHLAASFKDGQAREADVPSPVGDGWWHVRRYPVHDAQGRMQGVVDVALDITERKRLEESLAQWAAVAESTDDAIIATTLDGKILRWNPGAARIYGYSAREIVGSPVEALATEDRRAELRRLISDVAAGERIQQYETVNVTRDGSVIHVALTISPTRDEHGQITGISFIARDFTEHVKLREELINLSLVDALTGLHNRRGFFHLANQQFKVARRTQEAALLIFADVDHMKWINDSLGHQAGDRALIEAADVLRNTFRESDIIGRIGGDEFAVLAIVANVEESGDILARLQRELDARNAEPDRDYRLSLSVGVVDCKPDEAVSFDELMSLADARMYEHKRSKGPAQPGS